MVPDPSHLGDLCSVWADVGRRVAQLYSVLIDLGPSCTEAMRLRFDQEKNHFTLAYWSNLQSVMAHFPPARPRRHDDAPYVRPVGECEVIFFLGRIAVASPQSH
jgi:hypothetical protein